MSLTRLMEEVLSGLQALTPGWETRLVEKADALCRSLRKCQAELRDCIDQMARYQGRLKDRNALADRLAAQVQSFLYVADGPHAWKRALALDQLRKEAEEDRTLLLRCRTRQRDLEERLRELEVRLDDVRRRLDDV